MGRRPLPHQVIRGFERTNHAVVFQIRGHHRTGSPRRSLGMAKPRMAKFCIGPFKVNSIRSSLPGALHNFEDETEGDPNRLAARSHMFTATWRGSDFGQMPGDGFGHPRRLGVAGGCIVQMDWWTFHSGSLRLEVGGDGGDAVAGPGQNVLVG